MAFTRTGDRSHEYHFSISEILANSRGKMSKRSTVKKTAKQIAQMGALARWRKRDESFYAKKYGKKTAQKIAERLEWKRAAMMLARETRLDAGDIEHAFSCLSIPPGERFIKARRRALMKKHRRLQTKGGDYGLQKFSYDRLRKTRS
jgi:hypothetical protein